jgi:hypothetical protein
MSSPSKLILAVEGGLPSTCGYREATRVLRMGRRDCGRSVEVHRISMEWWFGPTRTPRLRFEPFSLIISHAVTSSPYAKSIKPGSRWGLHQIASAAMDTAAEKVWTQVDQHLAAILGCYRA